MARPGREGQDVTSIQRYGLWAAQPRSGRNGGGDLQCLSQNGRGCQERKQNAYPSQPFAKAGGQVQRPRRLGHPIEGVRRLGSHLAVQLQGLPVAPIFGPDLVQAGLQRMERVA